jgi:Uma2 family endonuclease
MVAIQERFPRFTPEEYLAWEEQQDLKYEYVGGEVRAVKTVVYSVAPSLRS